MEVNDTYTEELFKDIQDQVEWEMNADFDYFQPIYYKQQVVAGYNYEVIYDIGYDEYLYVSYYQDLDGYIEIYEVYYVENPDSDE